MRGCRKDAGEWDVPEEPDEVVFSCDEIGRLKARSAPILANQAVFALFYGL